MDDLAPDAPPIAHKRKPLLQDDDEEEYGRGRGLGLCDCPKTNTFQMTFWPSLMLRVKASNPAVVEKRITRVLTDETVN